MINPASALRRAARRFRLGPASRVSLGLCSILLASLLALDFVWDVLPDNTDLVKRLRERTGEMLAMQTASELNSPDAAALPRMLHATLSAERDVKSIVIRRADGHVVAQAGDHARHWRPLSNDRSDIDNVRVPLQTADGQWGGVEVSFTPVRRDSLGSWLREPRVFLLLTLLLCSFGFFTIYLRRVFHYLDPSAVIPERVRKAFDGFSEGVMVVDRSGVIVLANIAFRRWVERADTQLAGRVIQSLPWLRRALPSDPRDHPWMRAMEKGAAQRGEQLELPQESGEVVRTVVNCAPIQDVGGAVRGCVVTFDNVTEIEQINAQLRSALSDLEQTREQINRQNEELRAMAMRDVLTGCYNRRALFERFDQLVATARETGSPLCCIMTDIDHFKKINDTHGHAAGDAVLKVVARALGSALRDSDVLARYGGEEFCIALPGVSLDEASDIAERLRIEVESRAGKSIRGTAGIVVTSSFGVMQFAPDMNDAAHLIDEADKALYLSKTTGRNRVTRGGTRRPAEALVAV